MPLNLGIPVVLRASRALLLGGGLAAGLSAQSQPAKPPAPPPGPAKTLVAAALRAAKADHKAVLVTFSASWCGPCHQFAAFLRAPVVGTFMSDNYVVVSLTALELSPALENPGAVDLMKAMGGGSEIPYFYFLDANGAKLADSNVEPDGTDIGNPATPDEIEAFDKLLRKTAPRMTAAQRLQIRDFLTKAAKG